MADTKTMSAPVMSSRVISCMFMSMSLTSYSSGSIAAMVMSPRGGMRVL